MFEPCDTPPAWRKSSSCVPSECVEVASRQGYALIRDSAGDSSLVLRFTADQWRDFLKKITRNAEK